MLFLGNCAGNMFHSKQYAHNRGNVGNGISYVVCAEVI
jgi:hypothetical protein